MSIRAISRRARLRAAAVAPLQTLALQLAAVALSFILIALLVVTSSRQAFVAQNDNVSNQVTAAAVDLTDNDAGTAMFANVTGLMPGTNVDRCIDVTYTGLGRPDRGPALHQRRAHRHARART